MKNLILFLLLILFAVSGYSYSQDSTASKELRKLPQSAFGLGEKLEFEISYGFVTAGYAVMEIAPNFVVMNGRNCYDITVTVGSTTSFDWVYKFREYYKCYLDAEGIFPWKFEQHLKEPTYEIDFVAVFDHLNQKVKTSQTIKGDKKPDAEHVIPQYVQDLISTFYLARTMNFSSSKKDDVVKILSFNNDTTYNLGIRFLGREDAEVPAGDFRSFMVQPMIKEGAISSKADDIVVWISDDERKMPLIVQLSIIIGSVKAELKSYQNLAGPLNSKK
ncbi:MAG: DUF3108 domain-containing protein [Ignavibacteriae bacterium]|nr:DUF3108 domain-containing protein [Ignavibacteriota bacterium]